MRNWIQELDDITAEFESHFGGLTEAELNKADKGWSAGEHIDHLIKVSQSYYPVLDHLKKHQLNLGFLANIGFIVRMFGNMILKSVQPDNTQKVRTFPLWEPSNISADVIDQFKAEQDQLKEQIQSCEAFVKAGAVIHSPANSRIVYKLETAFDIIVDHQKRHLQSALKAL